MTKNTKHERKILLLINAIPQTLAQKAPNFNRIYGVGVGVSIWFRIDWKAADWVAKGSGVGVGKLKPDVRAFLTDSATHEKLMSSPAGLFSLIVNPLVVR